MSKSRHKLSLLVISLFLTSVLVSGCGTQPNAEQSKTPAEVDQILLASTIGPIDAGIVSALEDAFEANTGIIVRHVGAGTGATLKMAESGNFDLVMVHAKALEEKFVADGFGTERIDLMYNDFVIVGPTDDPAGIKGLTSVTDALEKIAKSEVHFISRGDRSGTHVKEMELWEVANINPEGSWYEIYAKGADGNVPTLKYANEQNAYTLIDRATYLTLKNDLTIDILVEKDELMLNFMTLIPVNPQKFSHVKHDLVMQFIDFATGKEGQTIIKEFGVDKYGEPLFFPNSEEGKKL